MNYPAEPYVPSKTAAKLAELKDDEEQYDYDDKDNENEFAQIPLSCQLHGQKNFKLPAIYNLDSEESNIKTNDGTMVNSIANKLRSSQYSGKQHSSTNTRSMPNNIK